jgi:glycosyltransferase involved in cell wall biosynthesis
VIRIGINAQIVSLASTYRQAGVSRFTAQAIQALQRRDRSAEYSVFVNDTARGGFSDSTNMRFHRTRLPAGKPAVRILWEQVLLPLQAARLDVLHCPVNVLPLAAPCPTTLTIHDLTFLRFPDRFRPERRRYLAAFTRLSARRARRIMTDSANTKQDVVELLGVPESNVEVVYPGLEDDMRRPSDAALNAFRARKGLPDDFILNVGTLEPRKNVELLIQAYGLLRRRWPAACPLVIGGAKGWMFDRIFDAVKQDDLQDHVVFPGYLAAEELPYWYAAARVFVYPSLYEGFGLPPLEAMACGTPVIASNASSLPEVVGEAGELIDPHDAEQLAGKLEELLRSNERREHLAQAGQRQAAAFTWTRAADQMARIFREAAN